MLSLTKHNKRERERVISWLEDFIWWNLVDLETPFSNDEIRNVHGAWSSQGKSCKGSDGFTASFYQHFRPLRKEEMCRFFKWIYNSEIITVKLNFSFISLIPKKQENLTVRDYKPISLLNRVMKIFTKASSIRLSKFMDKLVSQT